MRETDKYCSGRRAITPEFVEAYKAHVEAKRQRNSGKHPLQHMSAQEFQAAMIAIGVNNRSQLANALGISKAAVTQGGYWDNPANLKAEHADKLQDLVDKAFIEAYPQNGESTSEALESLSDIMALSPFYGVGDSGEYRSACEQELLTRWLVEAAAALDNGYKETLITAVKGLLLQQGGERAKTLAASPYGERKDISRGQLVGNMQGHKMPPDFELAALVGGSRTDINNALAEYVGE